MKTYRAPWGTALILISLLVTALCLGIGVWFLSSGQSSLRWAAIGSLALLAGSALFTIRGYSLTPEALLVHRLFWATRLPLADLQSAEAEPDAMSGSIRLFGNGGMFSFSGLYRNRALGRYRAFVTDLRRTVVLRFAARTVVISPDGPEEFVRALLATRGGGERES